MRLPAPLSRRNPKAYKNQFGHVLVIAGSSRMLGAAALCGLAAFRSGAGLVTVGVPCHLNLTLQAKIPNEIMTLPLPERAGRLDRRAYTLLQNEWTKYAALAFGPGLGQDAPTRRLVLQLIRQCPLPMVVDADALNIVADDLSTLKKAAGPRVLTPHPGEMARLTGLSSAEVESGRSKVAGTFADEYQCVVVLKGYRSCVASPDKKVHVNTTGNSGMATAGSGDVLTGMIAALMGQGLQPFEAAKFGCYCHGLAGDRAARRVGKASLIASDIIEAISGVLAGKGKS